MWKLKLYILGDLSNIHQYPFYMLHVVLRMYGSSCSDLSKRIEGSEKGPPGNSSAFGKLWWGFGFLVWDPLRNRVQSEKQNL